MSRPTPRELTYPLILAGFAGMLVLIGLVVGGVWLATSEKRLSPTAVAETPPALPGIGSTVVIEDVAVTLLGVKEGPVTARQDGRWLESKGPLWLARVAVKNCSPTKIHHYTPWRKVPAGGLFNPDAHVDLTDEFGNDYTTYGGRDADQIEWATVHNGGDVWPETEFEDVVLFKLPFARAERFTLTLPGASVEVKGRFKFTFTRDQVTVREK